ncbi:MAG TPA: hypothetical protein VKD70_02380 [Candidatus Acidoferrum sp.]|nr:hypothetical protein [Candidatus Acidoferrum sp.]
MALLPRFEIFSGQFPEKDATWIESVEGLGQAADRMYELAKEKPGPYFVFHMVSHQVLAVIDTTPKAKGKTGIA